MIVFTISDMGEVHLLDEHIIIHHPHTGNPASHHPRLLDRWYPRYDHRSYGHPFLSNIINDGIAEGIVVGTADGEELGSLVGSLEGDADGSTDGEALGSLVG